MMLTTIALAALSTAHADETVTGGEMPVLNAQLPQYAWGSDEFIYTRDSEATEDGFVFDYRLAYAHQPLTYERLSTQILINNMLHANAFAGWSVGNTLVGLDVPVYALIWGGQAGTEAGIGDVRVDLQHAFLQRANSPVGVVLGLGAGLPTSTTTSALGSGSFSGSAELGVDGDIGEDLSWAVNVGYEHVPIEELENLTYGPRVMAGAGLSMELGKDVGVAGELFARQPLDPDAGTGGNPMEFMLSGWTGLGDGSLRFGAGGALIKGVGAAKFRALLTWVPGTAEEEPAPEPVVEEPPPEPEPEPVVEEPPPEPEEPARVQITQVRIEINESVYFETNRSTIKPESFDLLNEVAELLNKHPEVLKVRIEGHTDLRGSNEFNQALSERRANSVRVYLIGQGVSADRLNSIGYGEERPLDTANTPAAWEKNRRVDFFIEERAEVEPVMVPVEEAPAEEAPAEEAPAEEGPVEQAPVEEAPAAEAPVEEASAEEAPVE
ncbi:MAG: OmpA family protein, partial [Myxococcota bacterium]|nr:OmpA family protein [Myxococcota bacterium]